MAPFKAHLGLLGMDEMGVTSSIAEKKNDCVL